MRCERGFSLIEVMFAMAFLVAALAWTATLQLRHAEGVQQLQAAEHLKLVADAAGKYLADNYASVLAVTGPMTPAIIATPMLIASGYLNVGFDPVNTYGQTYELRVINPTGNKLQALLISVGGAPISEIGVRQIAKIVGVQGGFVSSSDRNMIQGSFGGWQIQLDNFGIIHQAGHVGVLLFDDNSAMVGEHLYRNSVPGKPELNAMSASLDMRGNDVNSVEGLSASVISADKMQINNTYADSLQLGARLELSHVDVFKGKCSAVGEISRTIEGELLSCINGKWSLSSLYSQLRSYKFTIGWLDHPKPYTTKYKIPGGNNNKLCYLSGFESFVDVNRIMCSIEKEMDGSYYILNDVGRPIHGAFGKVTYKPVGTCSVFCM